MIGNDIEDRLRQWVQQNALLLARIGDHRDRLETAGIIDQAQEVGGRMLSQKALDTRSHVDLEKPVRIPADRSDPEQELAADIEAPNPRGECVVERNALPQHEAALLEEEKLVALEFASGSTTQPQPTLMVRHEAGYPIDIAVDQPPLARLQVDVPDVMPRLVAVIDRQEH